MGRSNPWPTHHFIVQGRSFPGGCAQPLVQFFLVGHSVGHTRKHIAGAVEQIGSLLVLTDHLATDGR